MDYIYITDQSNNKIKMELVTTFELKGYSYKYIIYKDLEGNEIKVNDGNTWINICPIDSVVTFE